MAPRPAPPEPTNGPTPGATMRMSGRACAPVDPVRRTGEVAPGGVSRVQAHLLGAWSPRA